MALNFYSSSRKNEEVLSQILLETKFQAAYWAFGSPWIDINYLVFMGELSPVSELFESLVCIANYQRFGTLPYLESPGFIVHLLNC